MESIDEKVEKLDIEKQERFYNKVLDSLYDRIWCRLHDIDYVNIEPYIPKVKEIVYSQMFGDGKLNKRNE